MASLKEPIKDWPEDERPRERLLRHGAESLSDAQLLAILLRTGSTQQTALDLGRGLLKRFGGLQGLEAASVAELCRTPGLGPAKAAQIKAALALGRRVLQAVPGRGPLFTASAQVYKYLFPRFHGLKREVFLCLLLDAKNRLMREVRISEGSLTASLVHPREAFLPAIRESAASVIFAHNHPSGDPQPSAEDIALTRRLAQAGELVGIPVLDHVVVGNGHYVSFRDRGLLSSLPDPGTGTAACRAPAEGASR